MTQTTGASYVIDSGLATSMSGYSSSTAYWLDETSIVLVGYPTAVPEAKHRNRLYTWKLGNGYRQNGDVELAPSVLSYASGRLFALLRDGKSALVGDFSRRNVNELAIVPYPPKPTPEGNLVHDRMNAELRLWNESVKGLWPLRRGDGYLEMGSTTPDAHKKLRLISQDLQSAVDLPISRKEFGALRYVEWRQMYFGHYGHALQVNGWQQRWKESGKIAGWWISSQGKVEKVDIPAGPWSDSSQLDVFPTAHGFVIAAAPRNTQGPGVYLATKDRYLLLLKGRVAGVSVSPDGNKIAFGHQFIDSSPSQPVQKLKAIDLSRVNLDRAHNF